MLHTLTPPLNAEACLASSILSYTLGNLSLGVYDDLEPENKGVLAAACN